MTVHAHDQAEPAQNELTALARTIDHTKLTFQPNENPAAAIDTLCDEARRYGFAAVCVRPAFVAQAKARLAGSGVLVATVIGFPADKITLAAESAHPTVGDVPLADKLAEVENARTAGADEFDLVMNVRQFKADLRQGSNQTLAEFKAIQAAAQGRAVKVIIETDLLSEDEIIRAATWCAEAGTAMVKTSTGMVSGGHGATLATVKLIRHTLDQLMRERQLGPVGIKASGGVKNAQQAQAFVDAGADRIGTSSGIAIVTAGQGSPETY